MIWQLMSTSFFAFLLSAHGYWWPFSSFTDSSESTLDQNTARSEKSITTVAAIFAPFEISSDEQKFLREAQHYLENLSVLDQCNLLIVNRLKSSCNKLSEEDLSKLGVNLLNCQSAVEGRKMFICNDHMKLIECTKDMDADMWNSYHIISNRARAMCHSMRQAEFRMKTEQTVNNMAAAALENVNMLQNLANGQKKLQITAEEAVNHISKNHDFLVLQQNEFKDKQDQLGHEINSNILALTKEKQIIAHRHKQIEEYTERINEQLNSLIEEIKSQDLAKKENEKEILKDLESVKSKADEVLKKLESVFIDVDHYQENIEAKQNKTLENLGEIQAAIAFINDVLNKLSTSFNNQIPWLHALFGDTIDKLNMVTVLLSHFTFFVVALLAAVFIGVPIITKAALLFIIPLNCVVAAQEKRHLSFLQMSVLLNLVCYVIKKINSSCHSKCRTNKREENKCLLDACVYDKLKYIDQANDNFCVPTFTPSKEVVNFSVKNTLSHKGSEKSLDDSYDCSKNTYREALKKPLDTTLELSKNALFREALRKPLEESFDLSPSSTSSPLRMRYAIDKNNSSLFLNTTAGGSPRCCGLTKSGLRCKNTAVLNGENCRLHAK